MTILHALFATLASWNWEDGAIHLQLGITEVLHYFLEKSTRHFALPGVSELPMLPCVKNVEFFTAVHTRYKLCITSQLAIAARLPNLEDVHWTDKEYDDQAESEQHKQEEFQNGLLDTMQNLSVTKVGLEMVLNHVSFKDDERLPLWREKCAVTFFDRLCSATQHVKHLSYAGPVDATIFYNAGVLDTPPWHCLRHLTMCMSLVSPNGDWYFVHHPDLLGDSITDPTTPIAWPEEKVRELTPRRNGANWLMDEDDADVRILPTYEPWQYKFLPRNQLNDDALNPLLLAFGRFLETQEMLLTASIVARRGRGADLWAVSYCAPGETSRYIGFDQVDLDMPRVTVVTGD